MLVIDSQVHCYEEDTPARPWKTPSLLWPKSATADEMVAAMDAVGVDAAINVSSFATYGFDVSYALEAYDRHPDRFALIRPVDIADPAVGETIADWASKKGTVGIRMMMNQPTFPSDPGDAGIARVFNAAAKHGMPVNLLISRRMDEAERIVAHYPDTSVVIDHLGLIQPHTPPVPDEPWAALPRVLKLAAHKNVSIKVSGACTLSKEPYPFNDIWEPLSRVFDAFGLDRCMWGTDWTRAKPMVDFKPAVDAFRDSGRLSDVDLAKLMGGSLTKIYNWYPKKARGLSV